MPERIQLRRTEGWRKPEGAIVVSRPSRWGNPYMVGSNQREVFVHDGLRVLWSTPRSHTAAAEARAKAVEFFRSHVATFSAEELAPLRGHDLACWCPLDQPCHADVLLAIANAPVPDVEGFT